MWAICPTSQFCRFFVFFASFRANSFFGVSRVVLRAFQVGASFDLLAGFGVFGVASCVKRGVSGVKCSGQNPGGGGFGFIPFIRCKNHTAGDSQRGRFALSLGRALSLPVSLSHYRGGVAPVGVVSGRSADIRTSVRNKCTKVKDGTFCGYSCQNFQPNLTEFGPNLRFQSNRILTESRNLCR
jgi:hypothetical protein